MAERDIIARITVEGGQQAAQVIDNVAKSEAELGDSIKQTNVLLDNQNKELKENKQELKQTESAQQSLKKQLRELKAQLAQLAIAGKQNTAEYKRLRDEAGNLSDAIADVNQEISQAGSDTRGLDQVIRVASTATAAFGLVEGAAALFGDENEELQKSLLKVNAAMTILTSLQQIQTEITRKDSIFTVAAAKAKALYAAATAGATGATKAFRVALIATGIGAIIALIGTLIANWDKFTNAVGLSNKALADNKKALDDLAASNNKAQSDLNRYIKLLKISGATQAEIDDAVLNGGRDIIDRKREELSLLEDQIKLEKQNQSAGDFFKGLIPFRDKVIDQKTKENKIDQEYSERLTKLKDEIADLQVAQFDYNQELKDRAIEDAKKKQDAYNKSIEEAKKQQEQLAKARLRELQDEIINFEVRNKSLINNDRELTTELAKSEVERTVKLLKLRENLYAEQLKQGLITKAEFSKLIDDLNREFDNFVNGLSTRAASDVLARLNEDILKARLQLERAKTAEGILLTQDTVDNEINLLNQLEQAEIAFIEQSFQDSVGKETEKALALLEIQKKYNAERLALQNSLLNQESLREKTNLENIIAIQALQGQDEIKLKREQLRRQQEEEIAAAEKNQADIALINDKYRLLDEELDKQESQRKLNEAAKIGNESFAVYKRFQDIRLSYLENQLAKGLITEEEFQKKSNEIKRRAAIADKLQAIFNATLQVFQAFGKGLIEGGPIAAAFYKGLALFNLAAAVATPIPKFRYGGQVLGGGSISPEGMLSGRSHAAGGMLIEAEGGEFITRREMTKKYLPILKAINQDKLGDVLYPKIPIMRTFGSVATQSQRKADKRMEMLIEEVQFMSQYIRQGNKYARVTADNTSNLKTSKKHHRV